MNEMNRISDEMLKDVTGGTGNNKKKPKGGNDATTTVARCDGPRCKQDRTFYVYLGGQGICSYCGTKRYDL